ncbi:MAG: hypothetical protein RSP_20970 [Rhodanobacter sp.]
MNVSSVSSALPAQVQKKPESAEVPGVQDNDGDNDSSGAAAAAAPSSAATVNGAGQTVGQLINVKA